MNKRIFVIDDDENVLELMTLLFADAPYDIRTAKGSDVIQELLDFLPDLILLDVRLHHSDKTGTQLCQELKRHALLSILPVVLLSAEYQLDTLATECGADGFLQKPFDLIAVKNLVHAYLETN